MEPEHWLRLEDGPLAKQILLQKIQALTDVLNALRWNDDLRSPLKALDLTASGMQRSSGPATVFQAPGALYKNYSRSILFDMEWSASSSVPQR